MPDYVHIGLTGPEQRAALLMARWAAEAGYRHLHWSVPNDASWPHSQLVGLPVRHTALPGGYDLLGRARWRGECVVCSLRRSPGGFEVVGVPGEEWLRPGFGPSPAPVPVAGLDLFDPDFDGDTIADDAPSFPGPARARPRLRLTAAAAALAIPVAALGGLVITTTVGQGPATPATATPGPILPAPTPSLPDGAATWASNARVTLAAVSQQLDTLAAAEAAWTALPPERRAGEPPAAVQELQATKAELAQQRAILQADLAAWESLQEVRTQLADTEEQLADVRRALVLGDTAASDQLRDQESRLVRQADAQRTQLGTWRDGVDEAVAAPLPEPVDAAPTASAVMAITEDPPPPQGQAPLVAAAREVEPDATPQVDVDPGDEGPDDEGPDDDERDSDGGDREDREDRDRAGAHPVAEVEEVTSELLPPTLSVPLPEPVQVGHGALELPEIVGDGGTPEQDDAEPGESTAETVVPEEAEDSQPPGDDAETDDDIGDPAAEDASAEGRLDQIAAELDAISTELAEIEADLEAPAGDGEAGGTAPVAGGEAEGQPAESPVDAPADSPVDAPAESPADPPLNAPAESPVDPPSDLPAESPTAPDDQVAPPGDSDPADDEIDAALDDITVDMTIDEIQVHIDGEAGTLDVTLDGVQIAVNGVELPDAGTAPPSVEPTAETARAAPAPAPAPAP